MLLERLPEFIGNHPILNGVHDFFTLAIEVVQLLGKRASTEQIFCCQQFKGS